MGLCGVDQMLFQPFNLPEQNPIHQDGQIPGFEHLGHGFQVGSNLRGDYGEGQGLSLYKFLRQNKGRIKGEKPHNRFWV